MKIEKNCVVHFHYAVAEVGNSILESSENHPPIGIVTGYGHVVSGLEQALLGKTSGDHFEITLSADQAYGPYREGLQQRIPKKHLASAAIRLGEQVTLQTRFGPRVAIVKKIGMNVVDVDLNHPMAGKDLHFTIDIVSSRAATAEEIVQGRVLEDAKSSAVVHSQ